MKPHVYKIYKWTFSQFAIAEVIIIDLLKSGEAVIFLWWNALHAFHKILHDKICI